MKPLRIALTVALVSLSTVAFAQSAAHDHSSSIASLPTAGDTSFAFMKTLAGDWQGRVTVAEMPDVNMVMHATLRVTSRGHVVVHEFQEANTPLDPTKYDHPVTMLYLDADRLMLVHYCDAGNRPRMTGTLSPDGRTIDFELVDISGSTENHMHHSKFTSIDADHHTEDWTFMMKDTPLHAHFDFVRTR